MEDLWIYIIYLFSIPTDQKYIKDTQFWKYFSTGSLQSNPDGCNCEIYTWSDIRLLNSRCSNNAELTASCIAVGNPPTVKTRANFEGLSFYTFIHIRITNPWNKTNANMIMITKVHYLWTIMVYSCGVILRSFPIASFHTFPLTHDGRPCHHSSRHFLCMCLEKIKEYEDSVVQDNL